MRAMILNGVKAELSAVMLPVPQPSDGQVLVRVIACGICRTDLHIVDGELKSAKLPLIPGHEVIGQVVELGKDVAEFRKGEFVGVPWLGFGCGKCRYCLRDQENLCEHSLFTGYTMDGGFAEFMLAYGAFCIKLPAQFSSPEYAPFLCAGLIGYRSYRFIPPAFSKIGLYGFGAAAHIIAQLAVKQGKRIFAFHRKGDDAVAVFALSLGASWAGSAEESPPEKLDAAIIFAPAGELIPKALSDCDKGGVIICGGIHMSDIPSFPYKLLWEERQLRSVANLTRSDAREFIAAAKQHTPKTSVELFPLEKANEALARLRDGKIHGAAVLVVNDPMMIN